MLKLNFLSLSLSLSVFMNCMAVSLFRVAELGNISASEYLEMIASFGYTENSDKISILKQYFSQKRFPSSLTPQFIYDKIHEGAQLLGFKEDHSSFLDYVVLNAQGSLNVLQAIDALQNDIKEPALREHLTKNPPILRKLLFFYVQGHELEKMYISVDDFSESSMHYLADLVSKFALQNKHINKNAGLGNFDSDKTQLFIEVSEIASAYFDLFEVLNKILIIDKFQVLVQRIKLQHVKDLYQSPSFEEDYRSFLTSIKENVFSCVSDSKSNSSFYNNNYIEDENIREQALRILKEYTQGIETVIESDAADKKHQIEELNKDFERNLIVFMNSIYQDVPEEERLNFERDLFSSVIKNR